MNPEREKERQMLASFQGESRQSLLATICLMEARRDEIDRKIEVAKYALMRQQVIPLRLSKKRGPRARAENPQR